MLTPKYRDELIDVLNEAVGFTWDGCHKIYVLLDQEQMDLMDEYGYDPLLLVGDVGEALETLEQWWDNSCDLRFIQAVETTPEPNDGFHSIVPQFTDDADL